MSYIRSQRGTYPQSSNQVAWSDEVNEMLGVEAGKDLPSEGIAPREIQGIKVWVNPLPPLVPGKRRRFALRVRCNCPVCGREMPVGRLRQHSRVHQEVKAVGHCTSDDPCCICDLTSTDARTTSGPHHHKSCPLWEEQNNA